MTSKGMFRAASITLVASMAIILSGCGVTSAASPLQSSQHAARTGKTIAHPTGATKQTIPKTPNWADMTAEQLGQYDKIHGGAPPFGGTDVVRVKADRAEAAIPNHFPMQPGHARFEVHDFRIIDSWRGKLKGKSFLLDVYVNRDTKEVVVGVAYAHRPLVAYSSGSARYAIKDFAGSYVIFAVPFIPGQYAMARQTPYFAINLMTGKLVNPRNGALMEQLGGCFPNCMGAPGAGWITGLSKKYPFYP